MSAETARRDVPAFWDVVRGHMDERGIEDVEELRERFVESSERGIVPVQGRHEEEPAPRTSDEETEAQREKQLKQEYAGAEKKQEPSAEEANGPAPGYNLVETPDGSLSAEVPPSWGVETGQDSEKEGAGPGSWSYFVDEYLVDEYLFSSITTAPKPRGLVQRRGIIRGVLRCGAGARRFRSGGRGRIAHC